MWLGERMDCPYHCSLVLVPALCFPLVLTSFYFYFYCIFKNIFC